MDAEKLDPGTILIFFHLKNNRNVVPNIGDGTCGMKLLFGTSKHGVLGLVRISSISGFMGIGGRFVGIGGIVF